MFLSVHNATQFCNFDYTKIMRNMGSVFSHKDNIMFLSLQNFTQFCNFDYTIIMKNVGSVFSHKDTVIQYCIIFQSRMMSLSCSYIERKQKI